MDPTQFADPAAGKVVRTTQGYFAFVPAPAPRDIHYDRETVLALSAADAALAELSGLGRTLPNPHLLIGPYLRREAVLSSRIEGTHADLADVLLEDVAPPREAAPEARADVLEVRNYATALEHGVARLSELPLSLRLVREMHELLLSGVRGEKKNPGEFRDRQNWIGSSETKVEDASYVPPPVDEMIACLKDWEAFVHERGIMPDLVQCAVMHEQFEAIHPFLDGNGRIGRLLITLFLVERSRLSQPLLYLSAYFERRRDTYYDLLQHVRTHADWRAWILFFLGGVADTATDAVRRARALMDLRERLRGELGNHRAVMLVDELFSNPYTTVSRAAGALGVSDPTARQVVASLVKVGLLREITGRSWGRVYVAKPILDALEGVAPAT
jgi:Fic family protein